MIYTITSQKHVLFPYLYRLIRCRIGQGSLQVRARFNAGDLSNDVRTRLILHRVFIEQITKWIGPKLYSFNQMNFDLIWLFRSVLRPCLIFIKWIGDGTNFEIIVFNSRRPHYRYLPKIYPGVYIAHLQSRLSQMTTRAMDPATILYLESLNEESNIEKYIISIILKKAWRLKFLEIVFKSLIWTTFP